MKFRIFKLLFGDPYFGLKFIGADGLEWENYSIDGLMPSTTRLIMTIKILLEWNLRFQFENPHPRFVLVRLLPLVWLHLGSGWKLPGGVRAWVCVAAGKDNGGLRHDLFAYPPISWKWTIYEVWNKLHPVVIGQRDDSNHHRLFLPWYERFVADIERPDSKHCPYQLYCCGDQLL